MGGAARPHPDTVTRVNRRRLIALDGLAAAGYLLVLVPSAVVRAGAPAWLAVPLLVAVGAPVAVRRLWPVPVFLVVFAASIAATAAAMLLDPFLAASFALYPVAVGARRAWVPTPVAGTVAAAVLIGGSVAGTPYGAWHRIGVVGLGAGLLAAAWTAGRMVRERQASNTDLVAIRLQPGADIAAAQARLREILPPDVVVLTHEQLVAHERYYWETATPIGFIFGFGSIMGLIVGMVIVYQILFSDIANHLREYATLKAIGYSNGYLARVVMAAALILAVIGFLPGAALCVWLYDVVAGATFLPLTMTFERAGLVFALIFGMCAAAGLLAMRKLRDASPADMF